jgi:S-adenosylmethionine:tRNA ribosyltransferase-isomerase
MRVDPLDYDLPEDLIAQEPAPRRDASRLLVLDRTRGQLAETTFAGLRDHLRPGDLLVLNDTRVLPARLHARKASGGRADLLLLARDGDGDPRGEAWTCMISTGRGIRPGAVLAIAPGFDAEVLGEIAGGRVRVRLRAPAGGVEAAIRRHGVMPVPPYIRREPGDPREGLDRERYQTVYAGPEGAIAAPTAGLHFTDELLRDLEARGVTTARLTLHVGPGTFLPLRGERLEDHRLEPEAYRLPEETTAAVAACRARGGRVVAVGTTVTRALEHAARDGGGVAPGQGWCDLYIVPGHRFRVVDALLTNFHLPRTSLLALVAAFAGRDRVLAAYREAIRRRFRVYSYGDAMLVL